MSEVIVSALKVVAGPVKRFVYDSIQEYLKFIKSYDDNMTELVKELGRLCAKKQDVDTKVIEGKERLRVMTRETAIWLKNLYKLIEREEMKNLLKEDRVAKITVKMMDQRLMKKLFKEDREIFDIVVRVVKKANQEGGDGGVVDAEESADYKKVAKIAREVITDIAEEFKKFIKQDGAAVAAVHLLNSADLEKLMKDDVEMAKILTKAEDTTRQEVEHNDHNEGGQNVEPMDNNIIKEKVGIWRKHMGTLTTFLNDENFKNDLSESAKLGLEVMDVLGNNAGSKQIEDNARQHRHCGSCVVCLEDYRHRHDMSQRAEIMVEDIMSMIAECPMSSVTRPKRIDELENIHGDFIEDLESREKLMHKILSSLKDDQVNVVGIFGMGGAGKTTLAKEIANKSDFFDKKVVVEVSHSPNIKGIQDQIAEGVNLLLDDVHTVAQRAVKLYNALKLESKKILIILDNVWRELKLDEVGIPHERSKDFCCKILITTRERQLCRVMDVDDANIFEMGLLNEREALKLFENQVRKNVDDGEFKDLTHRLLTKCGGLPLTIVAAASALRGRDFSTWCRFAEELEKPISSQVSSEYRETYSILETSYKLIEVKEKWIFFFLACLSPLDSAVSVDDLMRYGIGLDLFQWVSNLSEAMEQASEWANELVSSSLLLKDYSDGQVKIHDVVRASAISFAEKGKDRMTLIESIPRWMCEEIFEKVTAISLLSGHDFSRLSEVKAPMLEILLLKGDVSSTSMTGKFFQNMTNLKVLSLSNMDFINLGLPESMKQLKRLKTLHLHYCLLKDIGIIGNLVNLLVLSLRGSSLEELPENIGELRSLRLLDMGGCKGMINIPANVLARLCNLEGLYMFNSFDDWASMNDKASVSELNNFSHLNVLEMEVPNRQQFLTLKLDGERVEQLDKFKIHVGGYYEWGMNKVPSFCRVLELNDVDETENKCLRALLKKTDCLQVRYSKSSIINFVPQWDEEGFKDLNHFEVDRVDNVKFIVGSNIQHGSRAFANLELLKLYYMHSLVTLCEGIPEAGIFSNLRSLIFGSLRALKYVLPLTLVPLNLVEVSIRYCQSLKFIFIENAFVPSEAAAVETETHIVVVLSLLKSLILEDVESLSSVLGEGETFNDGAQESQPLFKDKILFPSLESLKLTKSSTVTIWSRACRASNFQNLKVIHISNCLKLQTLGSPSLFSGLVELEELSISYCHNLQQVITNETEGQEGLEHVIVFPRLKLLFMDNLNSLKSFYGGNYKVEFPNLKSLRFSHNPSVTNLVGSENLTALFSDEIEFPCLEELEVWNVSDQVMRLWNWSSSGVQGEIESGTVSSNPVPNLQKLRLGKRGSCALFVPHLITQNLFNLLVSDFNIKTLFSTSLQNREGFWTYSQLPKLRNLSVDSFPLVEELFENGDEAAARFCEQLTGLILKASENLNMIPMHLLKNIRSLCLNELSWEYVFSADLFIRGQEQLQLLENLEITKCYKMTVIIKDEVVENGEDRFYVFPHLKTLCFKHLSITNFALKSSSTLHFPSLEIVQIFNCEKLQSFCSGPFEASKLKQVELSSCSNLQSFLSESVDDVQKLSSLESVYIAECAKLVSFSSKPLAAPKLNKVALFSCLGMKMFSPGVPNLDGVLELPSMDSVYMSNCPLMNSFSPRGIKAPILSVLKINYIDYSKRANKELEDILGNLTEYHKRSKSDEDWRRYEENRRAMAEGSS